MRLNQRGIIYREVAVLVTFKETNLSVSRASIKPTEISNTENAFSFPPAKSRNPIFRLTSSVKPPALQPAGPTRGPQVGKR